MLALTEALRAGILERLKYNHKYAVVVWYAGSFAEKEALAFASLLQEAGWTVSGPFASENISGEGLQIGVPYLHYPCPSAHLLVDTLVSVGISVKLVKAETLPSTSFGGCSLLLGQSGANRL
ncbi:MAG TPA: hypothetical protein VEF05_16445 [Terriglobales bacterium]|nr:hypothetical protein [Terriglobales bacterium]